MFTHEPQYIVKKLLSIFTRAFRLLLSSKDLSIFLPSSPLMYDESGNYCGKFQYGNSGQTVKRMKISPKRNFRH